MSLELAVRKALENPIRPRGRTSISRFASILTDGYKTYIGLNRYKSHPLQARFSSHPEQIYIHSEISVLSQALRDRVEDFSDYTLYVARVLSDGTPALAKPCPGCMSALIEFGIHNLEYTKGRQ